MYFQTHQEAISKSSFAPLLTKVIPSFQDLNLSKELLRIAL